MSVGMRSTSLWKWTVWIVYVKDSWKGSKLPSWYLRRIDVQLAVNAWSWLIITNTWQSLSHDMVSIPTLTAGVNLQCQITSHDQTSVLRGTYNSLCWWPCKLMRCQRRTLLDWWNKLKKMCKLTAVETDLINIFHN